MANKLLKVNREWFIHSVTKEDQVIIARISLAFSHVKEKISVKRLKTHRVLKTLHTHISLKRAFENGHLSFVSC